MSEKINKVYYISSLKSKSETFISCCVPCVLAERKKGKREGVLAPIPKGDQPLHTYHIDHLGPMTITGKLYRYLLVIIDEFSKFVWIYPTKTTNTKEMLSKLKELQRTFGNLSRIITDRGSVYTSADFKEYCSEEQIKDILITTGVPRGNGQVERIHQIIIHLLTKLSMADPTKWFRFTHKVQQCINNTYQRSVKMTPFELLFRVKMRQKEDAEIREFIDREVAELYQENRQELRQIARENILKT